MVCVLSPVIGCSFIDCCVCCGLSGHIICCLLTLSVATHGCISVLTSTTVTVHCCSRGDMCFLVGLLRAWLGTGR